MKKTKSNIIFIGLVSFVFFICLYSTSMAQQKCYVDLVVAYTPEAARQAGTDSIIVSHIKNAVTQMNDAFVNSKVNHWVRLLRTVKVDYDESGCFVSDLNALWQGTNKELSSVHLLRQTYKADLAALIITNDQFCGLPVYDTAVATLSSAYCAIQYNCMVQNLSLAHMFGHMYGCGHAKYELDPPGLGVAFNYGHGYHWDYDDNANFYTIMGITDDVSCYKQGAYDCKLINFFSNPDVSYQGVPTGDKYANNTRLMNEQAKTLSDFYLLPANALITDTVYTADIAIGMALDTLSNGQNYVGKDSATVYFRAGKKIILQPGFSMDEGTKFETFIDSTIANCNQLQAKKPN